MTTIMEGVAEARAPDAIGMHFDRRPMKLSGWAAPYAAERASRDLSLSLMAGDMLLGTLRREIARADVDGHLGYSGPPCGFSVPDFGLAAFARITGLRDLAVVAADGDATLRTPLPIEDPAHGAIDPLGSRGIAVKNIRLTDLWLESSRDLSLRFEGSEQAATTLSAYQYLPGSQSMLVALTSGQVVGGLVSIARVKLFNPFLPILLIFKGLDGAIDALDVIPFPSLVRGGLHEAERLVTGHGGDDLSDSAQVSAALMQALLLRSDDAANRVAEIALDPAVRNGFEPILDEDLLAWIGDFLGIRISAGDQKLPRFIAEKMAGRTGPGTSAGHRLHVPGDSIPTIAALVNAVPDGLGAQQVTGGMAVAEWNRHGRIWSVWQPPLSGQYEGLQGKGERLLGPSLEIEGPAGEGPADTVPALSWPLAIAMSDMPTRVTGDSPFETAAEVALPLIRNGTLPTGAGISALVLCDRPDQSIVALLESLARQDKVGAIHVTVSRPTAKPDSTLAAALSGLFPERHHLVAQPPGMGRLERIAALGDQLPEDRVLILDGDTILPDVRTLATLLPMLDAPEVATVGCMVRSASGKPAIHSAGYAPVGFSLRGVPALTFGSIDPASLRQAATYAVAANSTALLITTKQVIAQIDRRGSSPARPDVDDVALGVQVIGGGGVNLCTTLVSVYSDRAAVRFTDLSLTLPYRLSMDAIGRIMASTTIVQTVR